MKWRMEEQYADANLGVVLYEQRRFAEATGQFAQALRTIDALATADPRNSDYQKSVAELLAWLADAQMSEGQLAQATQTRERHVALAPASVGVERRRRRVSAEADPGPSRAWHPLRLSREQCGGACPAASGDRRSRHAHRASSPTIASRRNMARKRGSATPKSCSRLAAAAKLQPKRARLARPSSNCSAVIRPCNAGGWREPRLPDDAGSAGAAVGRRPWAARSYRGTGGGQRERGQGQ